MGSSKKTTVGYRYYLGQDHKLCYGPVTGILRTRVDEKIVYTQWNEGSPMLIDKPSIFGGDDGEGGVSGQIDIEMGLPTQGQNDYLVSKIGEDVPAYRGVVSAIMRALYIGNSRYLKKWDWRIKRTTVRQDGLEQWYPEKAEIPTVVSEYSNPSSFLLIDFNEVWDYIILDWDDSTSYADGEGLTLSHQAPFYHDGPHPLIPVEQQRYEGGLALAAQKQVWMKKQIYVPATSTITANAFTDNDSYLYVDGVFKLHFPGYYGNEQSFELPQGYHTVVFFVDETTEVEVGNYYYADLTMSYVPIYGAEGDMNPAHIIREALTDPDWGMGYPESDIDDEAFTRAADTLYTEVLGMSLIWDRQKEIDEFIQEILRTIDASLYVSKSTGKFVLKLIRNDYSASEMVTLNEDSVERFEDYQRTDFGELVNSVTVVFYNLLLSKEDSVAVQDIALVQQQGTIIDTTRQYPGISNHTNATRLAERDLKALSSSLISGTVYADRTAANINIGDPFILDWPDLEINSLVMRAQAISYGNGRTNTIQIKCVQDVFDTPTTAIVSSPEDLSTPISGDALDAYPQLYTEMPYYMMVQQLGQTSTTDILANDEFATIPVAIAGKPSAIHINAELRETVGATYEATDTLDFAPFGELISAISPKETSFYITEGHDLSEVVAGDWGEIGGEIVRVDSIGIDSSENWLIEVGRGCLDTTPLQHDLDSAGRYIIFWKDYSGFGSTQYTYGEILNAKILTNTSTDQLTESEATTLAQTLRSRPLLPYPPANLLIEAESYPTFVNADSADNILLEWSTRNRLQQTGSTIIDHTEADISPEANTEYLVRLRNEFGGLEFEATGITDTFYNLNLSSLITEIATVEVWSVRDGYECWMPAKHTFEWNFVDSGLSDSQPYDSVGSFLLDSAGVTGDPYFENVVALLHMDGADASTTFTDVTGRIWTANGDAQIDTALSKFGGGSGLFDGSGDYVSTASSSAFTFGTGDFTVEGWIYVTGSVTQRGIVGNRTTGSSNDSWQVLIYNTANTLEIHTDSAIWLASTVALTADAWNYFRLTRSSGTLAWEINGTPAGSTTTAYNLTGVYSAKIGLDNNTYAGAGVSFIGSLDDIRITKGIARTGDVPTLAFPDTYENPNQYLAHYTMDNVSGTTLVDEAGTYDATLVGTPSFVAGQVNNAIDFDGVDDYFDTGIASLTPTILTVALWVNFDTIGTSSADYKCLFSSRGTNDSVGLFVYQAPAVNSATGNAAFRPHINTSNGLLTFDSDFIVTASTWTHLIIEYSSITGILKAYINNVEDANFDTGGGTITGTANSIWFGDDRFSSAGADYIMDGKHDEVYIYDRQLTADERTALYTA